MRRLVLLILVASMVAACGGVPASTGRTPTLAPTIQTISTAGVSAPATVITAVGATPTAAIATATDEIMPPAATEVVGMEDPASAAPTEVGPGPGEEGPPPGEESPYPDEEGSGFGTTKDAKAFSDHFTNATDALKGLRGYTYRVYFPQAQGDSPGPQLMLVGQVATQDERTWAVHQAGKPDRVVARWVQTGGKGYTDLSGRWETVRSLPFDPDFPVSFAPWPLEQVLEELVPSYEPGKLSTNKEKLGSIPAVRYDLEQRMGPPVVQSLWVAEEGGHLLRLVSRDPMADQAPSESIEVTPLDAAPRIAVPKLGGLAFEGTPPPWRVQAMGRERLSSLDGYRYTVRGAGGGDGAKSEDLAEGQLSAEQGRLRTVLIEDTEKPKYADLIYIGERAWYRMADDPWQPVSFSQPGQQGEMSEGQFTQVRALDAFTYLLPGEIPNEKLESAMWMSGPSLFGLNQHSFLYRGTTLPEGRLVGTETVNGVRSLHYRGKAQGPGEDEGQGGESPMEIDLWIAAEGHYLVRYAVTQKGGRDGYQVQVDITNIGEPFSVDPPRT